jgi:glutamate dehydrogenase/leucine dehydrogenase
MTPIEAPYGDRFVRELTARNPGEPEFHRAVGDVVDHLAPVLERRRDVVEHRILDRLTEPERSILFRVPWLDDDGRVCVNRGYRVQFSSTLGPYRGGLRFHPTVTLGAFKALGFEQTLLGSLSTLPMGGAAGGSDFDPKGRSDTEVMRFCQSFMTELSRHVGPDTDVLCADLGVGGREIGYLFGQHKRLTNAFSTAMTDKGTRWGGSLLRPEAIGYGVAYFADEMLQARNQGLAGRRIAVSGVTGAGRFAAEKSLELGARIVALSDASGVLVSESGIDDATWARVVEHTTVRRAPLVELADSLPSLDAPSGDGVWAVSCDVALPCAAPNELGRDDAETLTDHGCVCVCEGAPMATTGDAVALLTDCGTLFGPAKAAGIGSVVLSGLEQSQSTMRLSWTRDDVDRRLRQIVGRVHAACASAVVSSARTGDLVAGADAAAFIRLADSMIDQGLV